MEWNHEFSTNLQNYSFVQSGHDHCLFTKFDQGRFMALIVYVNDALINNALITGSHLSDVTALKRHLDVAFTIKDLGSVHYFVGVEISRSSIGTYSTEIYS